MAESLVFLTMCLRAKEDIERQIQFLISCFFKMMYFSAIETNR